MNYRFAQYLLLNLLLHFLIFKYQLNQVHSQLLKELKDSQNHWESLLFRMLCKNFGLKVNGDSFFSIAKSVDFSVVKKCAKERQDLEALLMGQAGLLEGEREEWYFKTLKTKYEYLKQKFKLQNDNVIVPKFFRLRPPNFPTVRLAQFTMLYFERDNLFSKVMATQNLKDFYELFNLCGSEYWDKHYRISI